MGKLASFPEINFRDPSMEEALQKGRDINETFGTVESQMAGADEETFRNYGTILLSALETVQQEVIDSPVMSPEQRRQLEMAHIAVDAWRAASRERASEETFAILEEVS